MKFWLSFCKRTKNYNEPEKKSFSMKSSLNSSEASGTTEIRYLPSSISMASLRPSSIIGPSIIVSKTNKDRWSVSCKISVRVDEVISTDVMGGTIRNKSFDQHSHVFVEEYQLDTTLETTNVTYKSNGRKRF